VPHGRALIAVQPDGKARYVPEDELAAFEALRAYLYGSAVSPVVLVARDGTAYLVPDGENVDWDELEELRARTHEETVCTPAPSLASDCGRSVAWARPLCPKARSLEPLQLEVEEDELAMEEGLAVRRPEGSVPRSPSLRKLSALLFQKSARGAGRCAAHAEPEEELVLEAPTPSAPAKAAAASAGRLRPAQAAKR